MYDECLYMNPSFDWRFDVFTSVCVLPLRVVAARHYRVCVLPLTVVAARHYIDTTRLYLEYSFVHMCV